MRILSVALLCIFAQASVDSKATQDASAAVWVNATTLHWNSHRPCATENTQCVKTAQQRLGEMAKQVGAKIVGAVELKDGHLALPGWQSSGQQCDNSTAMVAPGWRITKSGGFCMGGDVNKGFAVALVVPPEAVEGCPDLCVLMGHFPHPGHNVTGREEITRVCGAVMDRCMVGMGDWNAADPSPSWATLIGGKPALVAPRSNTCCYPFTVFSYDHTVTNIDRRSA